MKARKAKFFILFTAFVSCISAAGSKSSVGEKHIYKTVGEQKLSLYVLKPKEWKAEDSRPAIVFYHGGGWVKGGPYQFNEHSKYLVTRGLVCIQVEYRLINKREKPDVCIQDAKSAMRWVRSNAAKLGIDPNRIASSGGSAGGHLAAFVGMVDGMDDPQDDLKVSAKSNAMLLFNPVLDNGPGGYGYNRIKNEFKKYSPFHNISKDDPPAIFFLGDKDKLIPIETAQKFKDKMEAAGIACEVKIFKEMPHSFFNYSKYDHVPYYKTVLASDRFLAKLGWIEGEPTLKTDNTNLSKVESYVLNSISKKNYKRNKKVKKLEHDKYKGEFEKAASGDWEETFSDDCTDDWGKKWFLDGEVGKVTVGDDGMTLTAGPEFKNDSHHMVLWTKDEFKGDLKIEYDYTRRDNENRCVNIIYIQATGSGKKGFDKDITKWNDKRKVPSMRTYFNNMNVYHISYAAFGNDGKAKSSYIRGRRYMPNRTGLKGTELKPEFWSKTLFAQDVKHHITIIKQERAIYMKVENEDEVAYFFLGNDKLPIITEGRIGLRQMFTRSSTYKNFKISVPKK